MKSRARQKGIALIMSMILLGIIGLLAVGMAEMSVSNMRMSGNHRWANRSLESAQSGVEVFRYWLDEISISGSVLPADRLAAVAPALQQRLNDSLVTNMAATYDAATDTITIDNSGGDITLDSATNQSFSAVIRQIDNDTIQMDVTGRCGQFVKMIRTNFDFSETGSEVFNYGVATKGPLGMIGNAGIQVINNPNGESVYIESLLDNEALDMTGNSQIQGDVSIANSNAYVDLAGNSQIDGESGQAAIDNNVTFGAPTVEFPVPDPTIFQQYATNTVDSSTNTNSNQNFENIRVVSGTDPTFNGNIINGVIYIESPNHVVFGGNTTIIGIIVAEGDLDAPSSQDQLDFGGNLFCGDVSQLPQDSQFDGLRDMTGTFILAPGFDLSFSGNFNTIGGAIAASGISFSGNARGTISNTIINYSDDPMMIIGNSDFTIDHTNSNPSPSGFSTDQSLGFQAGSYSEPAM